MISGAWEVVLLPVLINVCLCVGGVVIIFKSKIFYSIVYPLPETVTVWLPPYPENTTHHSWSLGQSQHEALAWGQETSATGREVVTG